MRKRGRVKGGDDQEELVSTGTFGGYEAEVEERIERRERLAPIDKGGIGETPNRYIRGIGRRSRNEDVLHGPKDFAGTLLITLRSCVGGLDLPERRKRYEYPRSSPEEEEEVQ